MDDRSLRSLAASIHIDASHVPSFAHFIANHLDTALITCGLLSQGEGDHDSQHVADRSIAAEMHIINASTHAGTGATVLAHDFEEQSTAMSHFAGAGADADTIAEVAEADAHSIEVVAEAGGSPDALAEVAHAEAQTVEHAVHAGEDPASIALHAEEEARLIERTPVDQIHLVVAVVDAEGSGSGSGSGSESGGGISGSTSGSTEHHDAKDIAHAAREQAHSISEAAEYHASSAGIATSSTMESDAISEAAGDGASGAGLIEAAKKAEEEALYEVEASGAAAAVSV